MLLRRVIAIAVIATIAWMCSACSAPKGGIVILENGRGTGFTMDFNAWSAQNKCELSLSAGDVLQVEVARESGEIALSIAGKRGDEPYTGNDLAPGMFTVTISEADEYVVRLSGKDATGVVTVKRL